MTLKITTDNTVYNAGIIGFLDVLEECNISYIIHGPVLSIESDDLFKADLGQAFIDLCIKKFYKSTGIFNAVNQAQKLLDSKSYDEKEFIKSVKEIAKRFLQASIKTGIETLLKSGFETDILEIAEQLNKEEQAESAQALLRRLLADFEKNEVKKMIYIKSIIYTKVRQIWDGISFLNKNEAKVHPKESFDRVFVQPLKKMMDNLDKKAKKSCAICGIEYNDLTSFSYLNDIGIDVNRKKSAFWNFKHDLSICPLCNFIYACAVLGFNQIGQDMIFINSGTNIKQLQEVNIKNRDNEREGNYRYKIISQLILEESEQKAQEFGQYHSLEVLVRHSLNSDKSIYLIDIIDRNTLDTIIKCRNEINLLTKSYARYFGEPLQYAVLGKLLDRQDLYEIINYLLKESNGDYSYVFEANVVLNIQINTEVEQKMKQLRFLSNAALEEGAELRRYFYDGKNNENKLNANCIKLQNALRNEDTELFFDILFKLYSGTKVTPSSIFLEALTDNFNPIATGFILGLMGAKDKNSNKKENELKDVREE